MSFKRNLLVVGVVTSLALLAGCHTVGGTMEGMGQDVRSVGTAVVPVARPVPVHHKRMKRHHHKKSGSMDSSTTTKTTTDKTETTTNETNSNTSGNTSNTNSSTY